MAGVAFNAPGLLEPYKEVLSGGDKNWALYTLVNSGFSNELKFTSSGSGGLDELEDEFNDGKIMFAFCRVKDPNSSLTKFVLVDWLGEGVPDSRKGLFPTHSAAVAKQLAGAHVTIQARHDADVVPSFILKRVADSSGARYSVHNEAPQRYVAPAPVGSSYVPVGRPQISQTKPVAPPTPVGTAYESKRNELANIRAGHATAAPTKVPTPSFNAPPPPNPATAPATSGLTASEPATPPPVKSAFSPASFPTATATAPASSAAAAATRASEAIPDRPGPVGTAYTPVSLPKPGKLANRWQEVVSSSQSSSSEPERKPAFSSGGGGGGGGGKSGLTWSQRQEAARKQREEEDAASRAAGEASSLQLPSSSVGAKAASAAAIGGTAAVGLAAGATLGIGAGIAGAAAAGIGAMA
ncbi:hypothetical protein C6P46_003146, partial [Rhodotorula mucilaginosa]